MTSSSGYSTSYSAIRDTHQDLSIAGTTNDEKEFLTGYSNDPLSKYPMMTWNQWMNFVLFNEKYPTLSESKAILEKAIDKQEKTLPLNSTLNDVPINIYDVIESHPQLSLFKNLIDYVGYGKVFESNVTIFAPINDEFDKTLNYNLNVAYKPVSAIQTLRYHILPYIIKPWQLQDRKLRLRTDLERLTVDTDWTDGKALLINPITTTYIPPPAGSYTNPDGDPIPARPDSWFEKRTWEVPILKVIQCANGFVYIIARPIVPVDLM